MESDTTPFQASILEQQENLYDVKMECFNEIRRWPTKLK